MPHQYLGAEREVRGLGEHGLSIRYISTNSR
jgi:hypothetical protein